MGGNFLKLLVLLLGFSHLITLNAVPLTRTRNLEHEHHGHVISEAYMENRGKVKTLMGRMNYELNDYPGSGANNRHTPRRGSCSDC